MPFTMDGYDYVDEGCEMAPSCLNCPLPRCRYDVKGGARAMLSRLRDVDMTALRMQGVSTTEIAQQFGVSVSLVQHITKGVAPPPEPRKRTMAQMREYGPESRNEEMRQQRKKGVPVKQIAEQFGVSLVRVYQVTST